jgi:hypothetical protein
METTWQSWFGWHLPSRVSNDLEATRGLTEQLTVLPVLGLLPCTG